ncbi:hypothetical protein D3C81_2278430 [compost metagenome]
MIPNQRPWPINLLRAKPNATSDDEKTAPNVATITITKEFLIKTPKEYPATPSQPLA